jgi:hypothetical protein
VKQLHFYPNHKDGGHCASAVFRTLYKYYFDIDLAWKEAEEIQGFRDGKSGWNIIAQTKLARKGVKIKCIEPFDYVRFKQIGNDYFYQNFSPEVADYYVKHSTIKDAIPYIDEFEDKVDHEMRRASIEDIIDMLNEGYLVGAELNSRQLNNEPGFLSHYVLVHGFDGENFTLNDPGLPPIENRIVPFAKMKEVVEAPDQNNEVSGYYYSSVA